MAKLESVHPVLMCRDVSESARFYHRMGFDLKFQDSVASPKYAVIGREGVQLHLQWGDESQWAYPTDRPAYRFLVDDVDGLYADFAGRDALGGPPHGAGPWRIPADTPWSTREFHVRDPGGNSLQFYKAL